MSYHTLKEAWEVVNETKRLLEKDRKPEPTKPAPTVAATAKARPAAKAPAPIAKPSPIAKPTDFMALVENKMQSGLPRAKAMRAVIVEHPDLHAEFLATFNEKHRQAEALDRRRAGLERDLRESRAAGARR